MVVLSILGSALFGITGALIELGFVDYVLFAYSLFVQVVAVIAAGKSSVVIPFGQANFDVYRADANQPTALAT
jgi:hypothetical protein